MHALSGIRTLDPSVRAREDSSCLRPRGYCGRHRFVYSNITCRKGETELINFLNIPHLAPILFSFHLLIEFHRT
jgi:hypothetical protein